MRNKQAVKLKVKKVSKHLKTNLLNNQKKKKNKNNHHLKEKETF